MRILIEEHQYPAEVVENIKSFRNRGKVNDFVIDAIKAVKPVVADEFKSILPPGMDEPPAEAGAETPAEPGSPAEVEPPAEAESPSEAE